MEVETIKKAQCEATREIKTLGKKSGIIDASISNRIQEMEERISDAEDSIESMDTTIRENAKLKKFRPRPDQGHKPLPLHSSPKVPCQQSRPTPTRTLTGLPTGS